MQGIAEIDTQIQTSIEDHKNARAIYTSLNATTLASHVHCQVPFESPWSRATG